MDFQPQQARVLSEEEGFREIFREVTDGLPVRGNLVPGAHLAALLRQHGVPPIDTPDRDFCKSRFLELRDAFAP